MNNQLKDLVGQPLTNFTVQEYVEIFDVDLNNKRVRSHGCMKDELLAQALAEDRGNPQHWHPADKEFVRTEKVLILTDGTQAFRITGTAKINLIPQEGLRESLTERARQKLSPATQTLLAA